MYLFIFVFIYVGHWLMMNSHQPHLAGEWTCQVAVQPFKTPIFCLPRHSFNLPMNSPKLVIWQVEWVF